MGEHGQGAAAYWRATLRFIVMLLAVWAVVSFGLGILFVEPLNAIKLGGFPLGFWFAQQGAIYVFIVLILVYALRMDRLDRTLAPGAPEHHDLHEPLDDSAQ